MKKRRAQQKKGAIELSITTIIVIVLGITLLSLGLVFIRGLFGKISGLTEQAFGAAQSEIEREMAPDQKFYVGGITIDVKSGKSTTVNAGVQNFGDIEEQMNKFSLDIEPGPQGGSASWFILPGEIMVPIGDKGALPFEVQLPKGIEIGKTFSFTVIALKDGQFYDNKIIIVKVK